MQELLYLYGFVIENNPDDYLMVIIERFFFKYVCLKIKKMLFKFVFSHLLLGITLDTFRYIILLRRFRASLSLIPRDSFLKLRLAVALSFSNFGF